MSRRVYRPKPGEIQSMRIQQADKNTGSHTAGWPHYDRKGNCLCTSGCCFGRDGCRCPACTHQSHR